jgi:NDP-sugar pyrophosphorylase family protein
VTRHAIVLAGGRGTRLRPYTLALPKPLVPIGDVPIVAIVLQQLARAGFASATLAVNHQADLLRAYLGDGGRWGIALSYSLETTALGTVGPLTLLSDPPEHFLVTNADVLTDLDFGSFLDGHRASGAALTVAAARRDHAVDFGVIASDGAGYLSGFQEKPVLAYQVSMGVYGVTRSVIERIPRAVAFGFDQLLLALLADGIPVRVHDHDGYWLDVGRPEDYERANAEWPTLAAATADTARRP